MRLAGEALAAGVDEAARPAPTRSKLAATGGDDYELLVCLPPAVDAAEAAAAAAGLPSRLGEVRAGSGVALVGRTEPPRPGLRGFEHL